MPRGRKKRLGCQLDTEGSKGAIPVASGPSLGVEPLEKSPAGLPAPDDIVLDANIKGLEPLAEQLTETGKKILNVILKDFAVDASTDGVAAEKDIFKALRAACARAGMLGTESNRHDQTDFFKTLADPQFMNIVKTTGQGLIGINIVPIVAKVIQQAMEGDKTSQRWALEITGILQGKYDFYLQRYNLTHNTINAGEINFDGKSDKELEAIMRDFVEVEVIDAQSA